MDRTGKIILGVSILLLIGAPVLQNKFGPKTKSPVADTNGSLAGTNVVAQTTNKPPEVKPSPIDGTGSNTNTVPLNPSTNAVPVTPGTEPVSYTHLTLPTILLV